MRTNKVHISYRERSAMPNKIDFVVNMPTEMGEHILCNLDVRSLLVCSCVSKKWNKLISSSEKIWLHACRRSGLVINDKKSRPASYWKTLVLEMSARMREMKTSACFTGKMFEDASEKVLAMYYHNGKIAIATLRRTIQIWNCATNVYEQTFGVDDFPSSLKFDDSIIMWGTRDAITSRFLVSGKCIYRFKKSLLLICFDFLTEHSVVAGSFSRDFIVIWDMSTGAEMGVVEHSKTALMMTLAPKPPEKGDGQKSTLLFNMDDKFIHVVELKISTSSNKLTINKENSIKLDLLRSSESTVNHRLPSFKFDGKFLYFPKYSPDELSDVICKWDVKGKQMVSETYLDRAFHSLLGVGKKYMAVYIAEKKGNPYIKVFDKETKEVIVRSNLPKKLNEFSGFGVLGFGETSWLDGLNGENDNGLVFACVLSDTRLYTLSWIPRKCEGEM